MNSEKLETILERIAVSLEKLVQISGNELLLNSKKSSPDILPEPSEPTFEIDHDLTNTEQQQATLNLNPCPQNKNQLQAIDFLRQ